MEENKVITPVEFLKRPDIAEKFKEILGTKSQSFLTTVMSIVASNEMLKKADPVSVYMSALTSATMGLPINPNLGFAYILPYDGKEGAKAQFQIGYKGFIQLAQRSGQFKTISATEVREGQIISYNPLTGYEFDFNVGNENKVIGYASYFKLLNGFEKIMYMTVEQLEKHAYEFSQTYKSQKSRIKEKSLWTVKFDEMAKKTVIKLLLSKFAPLSIEMQRAIISDQAVINDVEKMDVEYIDNQETTPDIGEVVEGFEK